jgi:hypothetical protein
MIRPDQGHLGARTVLASRDPAFCRVPGAPCSLGREARTVQPGTDPLARNGTPIVTPASGTVTAVVGIDGGNQITFFTGGGTRYTFSHRSGFGPAGLQFETHPGRGPVENRYPVRVTACR